MATLISQPSAICFSSDIEDIVFGTTDENGVLVLSVGLPSGGNTVNLLEETMYPSIDGSIVISDISSLVEPYARERLMIVMRCSFTDGAGTCNIQDVFIYYSMADVGTSFSDFNSNHFLTILNGEKLTAMGREERLYAYSSSPATVIADVQLANGQFNTLSAQMNAVNTMTGNVMGLSQYDVSPSRIADLLALTGARLLGYTIEVDSRRQNFRCVEDQVPPAPSLVFVNSFGCEEFIHCVGKHKKDSKYERKSARIKSRLKNYRVTEDRQFTANTGWLNEAMADWADDLFRSEEVFLWVDGQRGREVVVSDSKSEITNEDDNMPAFEFTYTYAQRIHNVMQSGRVGRIFDNTFDRTFN